MVADIVVSDDPSIIEGHTSKGGLAVFVQGRQRSVNLDQRVAHLCRYARDNDEAHDLVCDLAATLAEIDVGEAAKAAARLPYRRLRFLYGDLRGLSLSTSDFVLSKLLQAGWPEARWRKALDLCCGCGYATSVLVDTSDYLVAVDIDASRKAFCEANLQLLGRPCSVIQGDALEVLKANAAPGMLVHADPDWGLPGHLADAKKLGETVPDASKILDFCRAANAQLLLRLPITVCTEELASRAAVFRCEDIETEERFIYAVSPEPQAPLLSSRNGIVIKRLA